MTNDRSKWGLLCLWRRWRCADRPAESPPIPACLVLLTVRVAIDANRAAVKSSLERLRLLSKGRTFCDQRPPGVILLRASPVARPGVAIIAHTYHTRPKRPRQRERYMRTKVLLGAFTVALVALSGVASAAGTAVLVSGNTATAENNPGWMFNRDPANTTPFVFDFDKASIGAGSLHVLPIGSNPADKMIAEFFPAANDVATTSLSYDFQIGANRSAADAGQFYLNVYANFASSPATKYYDCRYDIVPTTGSTSAFTTVVFDPTASYTVATRSSSPHRCPASPAAMSTIGSPAVIRAFAINVGDTTAADAGLSGYLDNVVVNIAGSTTVYDFGPASPARTDQCKMNGWTAFGFSNQGQCIRFVNTGQDSR